MDTATDERTIARRRLILRDSLAFLSLLMVTAVLFAVTLFLFRSFTTHRGDLARRWSERGSQAMQSGRPEQAIVALRTALSYAPGTRAYELLLARALGEAGHVDEAANYFMSLWSAEPGNGLINLELARLAARRNDRPAAVNYYRASIYGTWEGDGVARRAEVRLELARYLITLRELAPARMELLIAGGNVPDNADFDVTLGRLLEQADDAVDASTYYHKAMMDRPTTLPHSMRWEGWHIAQATTRQPGGCWRGRRLCASGREALECRRQTGPDLKMSEDAGRILALKPTSALPVRERVARILADRALARKRFEICSAQFAAAKPPATLQELSARWAGGDGIAGASALSRDPAAQDSTMQLVYDTELVTAEVCPAPAGDDALLLLLAQASARLEAGSPSGAMGAHPEKAH